jgi:glycosyltransferase involved in cell wall biosynthesis
MSKKFWQYYSSSDAKIWVSILIASYNTKNEYIIDCLKSIENQIGNFGVELVWINDGSDEINTLFLRNVLTIFKNNKNNLKIKYFKMSKNKGLSYCLNYGVTQCENELIIRMDSDDIMNEYRIIKQINFMEKNSDCVICGTDIVPFSSINGTIYYQKKNNIHPEKLTWDEYKITKKTWILNHPTLCFKKSAVLEVGNYDKNLLLPFEDFDLEIRLLKKYGFICNIKENLLLYRIHVEQITNKNRQNSLQNDELKKKLVEIHIHL